MKHVLKSSAIAAAALAAPLALAPAAQAQQTYAECISQQRNQQVAGAVIGGLLGAVVGAQIHNARESDRRDDHYRNQHYGHRGWDRHRGHGRYRGHRGRGYVEPYQRRSNDGAVIAGAGLGALAGGAVSGRAAIATICPAVRARRWATSRGIMASSNTAIASKATASRAMIPIMTIAAMAIRITASWPVGRAMTPIATSRRACSRNIRPSR